MELNLELELPPALAYCLFCQKCCSKQTLILNGEMPGAVRSSKLEQQLEHLFILRQLLDIPSHWCEQALARNDGECDPNNWFRICADCIELVRKGWNVYQQVLRLESKLKSVKQRVKNVIQESVLFRDEYRVVEDGIDYEIRTIVLGGKVSEAATNDQDVKYCPIATESKADIPEAISVLPTHFLDYDDEVQLPVLFDITYQECGKVAETGQKKKRGRPKGSKNRNKSEENQTSTTTTDQDFEPDLDDSQSNRNPESPEWNPDSIEFNADPDVLYPDADEDSLSEEFDDDEDDSNDEDFKPIPTSSANPHSVKRTRGRPKGSISRNPRAKSNKPNKCGSRWKECPLCPTRWNTQKDFESHMDAHEESKTNGGAFNCDICPFAGRDEMDLKHHTYSKHTNPMKLFPMKYPCKKCDFVTEKLVTLRAHVQEEHPDQGDDLLTDMIPTCSICSKTFNTARSLIVHERKMHPELYGVEQETLPCACDQCPRRFTNKLHLQYHINHTHLRVNNHICTICGKGFKYRLMLERHEGTHRETRDYVCDVCGVDYNSQSALDGHSKRFHSDASATTSKLASTNEETYKCKYCDMTSTFQLVIFRHMEVHKAEMGHKCDLCQKCYTSEQGLKRHKSINHSNNTAHCPYCFKTFMSEPYMKDHIRKYCKVKDLADKTDTGPKVIDSLSLVPAASIETNSFINDFLG